MNPIFDFEGHRLDVARRLLCCPEGKPIKLGDKAFDALAYLLEHSGKLLPTSALLTALWPHQDVEEGNLRQQISALRKALRDGHNGRRFIATVAGQGYQFVATVRRHRECTDGNPTHQASLAVLPLANLTGNGALGHLAEGITEEITTLLAKVPRLRVAPRGAVFACHDRSLSPEAAARELGVSLLLEGSLLAFDSQVRICLGLVDVAGRRRIWSETYSRGRESLFAIEAEIAAAVSAALGTHIGDKFSYATGAQPTANSEAYALYLQGRAILYRSDLASIHEARRLFRKALELDPKFAQAHGELAISYVPETTIHGRTDLAPLEHEAKCALALDPTLDKPRAALANGYALRGDYVAAERCYHQALSAVQTDGLARADHALYVLACCGHHQAALREVQRAYAHSAAHPPVVLCLAIIHSQMGHDAEAEEHMRRATALGFPGIPVLEMILGAAARRAARYGEAGQCAIASLPPAARTEPVVSAMTLAYAAAGTRNRSTAVAALEAVLHAHSALDQDVYVNLLLAFSLLGELELAHDVAENWLTSGLKRGLIGNRWSHLWMPELAPFRRHARFASLANRLGLTAYWSHFGPADDDMRELPTVG